MNRYETVFIINPNVEEAGVKELTKKFSDLINNDGKVESVEELGKRKLAYEIKKNKEAFYMQLDFDETGKQILEKITGEYVQKVDVDGNSTAKTIEVRLDGQPIIITSFKEAISSGIIHVPMGNVTTDYEEYYQLVESVKEVANLLNGEKLPLVYKITDEVGMQSIVTKNIINIAIIVYAVLVIIITLYMIIKYKFEGFRQAIFNVAYLAALLILFRYINVSITINSLIALVILIMINYIFSIKFLNKFKKEVNRKKALKESLKELYLTIIPVAIIAIIFTFMSAVVINSVGTTIFWGLIVQVLFTLFTLV